MSRAGVAGPGDRGIEGVEGAGREISSERVSDIVKVKYVMQ